MIERFNCYIHTPATRATGREIRPDGEYVLASDYEKLEAQNAELRKQCSAFHAEANDHYRASVAANATLDRLREVVRSDDDEWQDWEPGDLMRLASAFRAILYPTPENDND